MGNYHVRFCTGGGAGDCPTDRSAADALRAPRSVVLGCCFAVCVLACLARDRARLTPRPLGPPSPQHRSIVLQENKETKT